MEPQDHLGVLAVAIFDSSPGVVPEHIMLDDDGDATKRKLTRHPKILQNEQSKGSCNQEPFHQKLFTSNNRKLR